jgi:predicted O-methyltransferase YrrM
MNVSLPRFSQETAAILESIASVEGQLTPREARFLAMLAAFPTCQGAVLEIGSFKGRSTIVLAKATALAGHPQVVAVDPLTSPASTDPSLGGKSSGWDDFQANLRQAGVLERVEFHRRRSNELAAQWHADRRIRLLWIDGDHTYRGTKADFDAFAPFLADGAVVALHDVLHHHGGPTRVFAEDILLSDRFGAAGVCGSIGWAQCLHDPAEAARHQADRIRLYRRVQRLIPYVAFGQDIEGWNKLGYKLARAGIPHGEVAPRDWLARVRFSGGASWAAG